MKAELSAGQARRIALAAQGLARPRPDRPADRRAFRALARRLGALQIDSVNVVARAHYLPVFARLGAYPMRLLQEEAWGATPSLFEYWGHAASLMPLATQPLFRWRMARAQGRWRGADRAHMDEVLRRMAAEGPLTGGDFAEGPRRSGWWEWSAGKQALERLFHAGEVMVKTRNGFERVYDLTERTLPTRIAALPTPGEAEAHRALLLLAARALGVATEADLADYFRLLRREVRPRLAELLDAGGLIPVRVRGWRDPAFLHPAAVAPRRAKAAALLSPFDNLIWATLSGGRPRTQRLFDVRFRIEIYTPAEKRQHGYYVFLFLHGEAIAARVDLKADRQAQALRVRAAHLEPGARAEETAAALAGELQALASWLDLESVAVDPIGDLAPALAATAL